MILAPEAAAADAAVITAAGEASDAIGDGCIISTKQDRRRLQMHDGIFKEESWAKLEKPERLRHLNPEETLIALGLKSGDSFADFGSGTGIFVIPALKLVGRQGRVYAVERSQALIDRMLDHFPIQPDSLIVMQQDLMALKWDVGQVHHALLCHVAHELPDLAGFFHLASAAVCPGGKMSIIEWCVKEQPQGPPIHKRISPEALCGLLKDAGWIPEKPVLLGEDFYRVTAIRL